MAVPAMTIERLIANKIARRTQLRGGEALGLYLAKIKHNLTALDTQSTLLRSTLDETKTLLREIEPGPQADRRPF
jgi:hypothetical protein